MITFLHLTHNFGIINFESIVAAGKVDRCRFHIHWNICNLLAGDMYSTTKKKQELSIFLSHCVMEYGRNYALLKYF